MVISFCRNLFDHQQDAEVEVHHLLAHGIHPDRQRGLLLGRRGAFYLALRLGCAAVPDDLRHVDAYLILEITETLVVLAQLGENILELSGIFRHHILYGGLAVDADARQPALVDVSQRQVSGLGYEVILMDERVVLLCAVKAVIESDLSRYRYGNEHT